MRIEVDFNDRDVKGRVRLNPEFFQLPVAEFKDGMDVILLDVEGQFEVHARLVLENGWRAEPDYTSRKDRGEEEFGV